MNEELLEDYKLWNEVSDADREAIIENLAQNSCLHHSNIAPIRSRSVEQ